MISEIPVNPIGNLFDLSLAMQGADPLAASSTKLGAFDAVLRKLDMSGKVPAELADDSDTPDQATAIPGSILPLANLIDLPGGNFLPSGDETPHSGETGRSAEVSVHRAVGPMASIPLPDVSLATILPGGFPVAPTIQPPHQRAAASIPAAGSADIDVPALVDGASTPPASNPATMAAIALGLQAAPQVLSDAAASLQLPTGQPVSAPLAEPPMLGQQPDEPGETPAASALVSRDRAPSPIEAVLKEITAHFPPRPQTGEGEGPSPLPADGFTGHRPGELPSAPLAHSGSETVLPGLSRALDGPASPHLAEALENLVERLADARDRVREARGEMVLRHTDFGSIRAQIVERTEGLQVALSSSDPDFAPSAQTALGERAAQTQSQQQGWSNGSSAHDQARRQGSRDAHADEAGAPGRQDPGGARTVPGRKNGLFA